MQPSQETRVLAKLDGINWDLRSGIVENARVVRAKRPYSHFARLGAGIGGGGASAVGTTNFNKADGSDVSSENEYRYQRHVFVSFLRKRDRNTRAVIHFAITHLATSDGKPGAGACLHY